MSREVSHTNERLKLRIYLFPLARWGVEVRQTCLEILGWGGSYMETLLQLNVASSVIRSIFGEGGS